MISSDAISGRLTDMVLSGSGDDELIGRDMGAKLVK
jgi:hypothetical protein